MRSLVYEDIVERYRKVKLLTEFAGLD
jgi:hypothetical protein